MLTRLNKFVAAASGLSRRAADLAIAGGRVRVNGHAAQAGQLAAETDVVTLDGRRLVRPAGFVTIILNKPAGYVCSRAGQGSQTIYALLPPELHALKSVGRLDKESSGLLLMTDDGQLAQQLTHPRYQKVKTYEIRLDKPLLPLHRQMVSQHGIMLNDGLSRLGLERQAEGDDTSWRVIMREGRNRQIRRTFAALGYTVIKLHRTQFGNYQLAGLKPGEYRRI